MAPKSAPLVLAILSVMAVVALGVGDGDWEPIRNLEDPEAVSVAYIAVAEYNKQKPASLSFVALLKAEKQVVDGVNYRLVISAKDAAAVNTYTTVVFAPPPVGKKPLQLISFVQN